MENNNNLSKEEEIKKQQEDDFFSALADSEVITKKPASIAEKKREDMAAELEIKKEIENKTNKKSISQENEMEKFEKQMLENQANEAEPAEEKPSKYDDVANNLAMLQEDGKINENTDSVPEKKNEPVIEKKPVEKASVKKNSKTVAKVLNENEYVHEKEQKNKPEPVVNSSKDLVIDDLDSRVVTQNRDIANNNYDYTAELNDINITDEKINNVIETGYTDEADKSTESIKVSIVEEDTEDKSESKPDNKEKLDSVERKPVDIQYYGGDGETSSFKIRTSRTAKILRNVEIEDTEKLETVDISKKGLKEQQNIYLNTVLPTLQPSYSVVPFIISGVVITMTAFTWPDIMDICKIEEKAYDSLDPDDEDYIYDKNKIFLEKRRKQLDLFYNHIFSVSGFKTKPSKDELFGKILKFPDFQQLFFAAYAASFQKPYNFTLVCSTCGTEQEKSVHPKQLCFLLNKNINIDQLNRYIERGSTLETDEIYKEFQKEKIVEMSNGTYRTGKKLPVSSFVYELKVPTIYEALDTLDEIVEIFKNKPLEITDDEGTTVSVDSSMNLPKDLIELRSYLYIKSLIVGHVVSEDKTKNTANVGFLSFTDKNAIVSSIYNLSSEDHKELLTDKTLRKLLGLSGIRHAIKAGVCVEKTCGSDMGIISIEPETLFFIIAQQESVN